MPRTQDFRDSNKNGVDDRDENTARRQNPQASGAKPYTGQNPAAGGQQGWDNQLANQHQGVLNQMQNGSGMFGGIMQDMFGGSKGRNDDGYTYMRDAFQFDAASKMFNTMLGMGQSEFNLAQNKEGMRYANMLDRQTMQESRNHIFGLNMQTMDKQFNLTDEMANRDYGRNLGTMAAFGEQTRKNYQAEGVQQRLGLITSGEQQRKNIAATGFQNRLQSVTEGEQERLNIGKTAKEERATMTHSDFIAAGREKRHNKSARNTAMSF